MKPHGTRSGCDNWDLCFVYPPQRGAFLDNHVSVIDRTGIPDGFRRQPAITLGGCKSPRLFGCRPVASTRSQTREIDRGGVLDGFT